MSSYYVNSVTRVTNGVLYNIHYACGFVGTLLIPETEEKVYYFGKDGNEVPADPAWWEAVRKFHRTTAIAPSLPLVSS